MKLTEEQSQSLITSLLGFVRRVSFQGSGLAYGGGDAAHNSGVAAGQVVAVRG